MKNIMSMENGTKIRHKKTGATFLIGEHVNEVARVLYNQKYVGMTDYINESTQDDYEVVQNE